MLLIRICFIISLNVRTVKRAVGIFPRNRTSYIICQDQLHNLPGPVQTKNAVPLAEIPLHFQGGNSSTLNQACKTESNQAYEASPDQRVVSLHTTKQAKSFSLGLE